MAAQALRAMADALEEPVAQRDVKPDFAADLDELRDAAARPVAAPAPKPARKRKRNRSHGGKSATMRPEAAEPHEAAGLVDALAQRHGTLEAAATALGVRVSTFGLWRSGRISEGALARLRDAATAPRGRGHDARDARQRQAREASAAPEEGAGAPAAHDAA